MMIKLYSFSFKKGGAAIAADKFLFLAKRIALSFGFEAVVSVSQDHAGVWQFLKRCCSYMLVSLQYGVGNGKRSLNFFTYKKVLDEFRDGNCIHHIHWINNDTLSVFDFNKIPRYSIVTLHDEWFYCGVEHYARSGVAGDGFLNGYCDESFFVFGLNWSPLVWSLKNHAIADRGDLVFTVPSLWMLERARASLLLKNKDIRLLPNPINTDIFSPLSSNMKNIVRAGFGFDDSHFVICFSAINSRCNPLKGTSLLLECLSLLEKKLPSEISGLVQLLIFGGNIDLTECERFSFGVYDAGYISTPVELAKIYNASDCVVVASLVESFGQVAAEAQSCGVPVVAFSTSGLRDIVVDGVTGYLSMDVSAESLCDALLTLINVNKGERYALGRAAREHIENNFSYSVVTQKYHDILDEVKNKIDHHG